MSTRPRDLITLLDYTAEDIGLILRQGIEYKRARLTGEQSVMRGRTGVLIFEKPSLRTRVSFDTAIHELGGHTVYLASEMVGIGSRESVADVARNLERWVHLVVFRTFSQQRLVDLARHCGVPVINALTDSYHPCQALAFGMTVRERLSGPPDGDVVFVGDGNNVCHSLMVLCATLGWRFTAVCPQGYEPSADVTHVCTERAAQRGAAVTVTNDLAAAVRHAAIVYTDVWASMGQEKDAARRAGDFRGFQINAGVLSSAPSHVLLSHCLPAHRGEEITDDVLDSRNCMAFDEAENRLHVQKAVIAFLLS